MSDLITKIQKQLLKNINNVSSMIIAEQENSLIFHYAIDTLEIYVIGLMYQLPDNETKEYIERYKINRYFHLPTEDTSKSIIDVAEDNTKETVVSKLHEEIHELAQAIIKLQTKHFTEYDSLEVLNIPHLYNLYEELTDVRIMITQYNYKFRGEHA